MTTKRKTLDIVTEQIRSFADNRTKINLMILRPAYTTCVKGYVVTILGDLVLCADRSDDPPTWKVAFKLCHYKDRKLTKDNGLTTVMLNGKSGTDIYLHELAEEAWLQSDFEAGAEIVPITSRNRHL